MTAIPPYRSSNAMLTGLLALGAYSPPHNALNCLPPPPSRFKCPLRRQAWINTAGGENVPYCYDVRGNLIFRDDAPGSAFGWDCDHIIPGGTDAPWNLRAMQSSCNRSEGDRT